MKTIPNGLYFHNRRPRTTCAQVKTACKAGLDKIKSCLSGCSGGENKK
jgi:hypothetical protein